MSDSTLQLIIWLFSFLCLGFIFESLNKALDLGDNVWNNPERIVANFNNPFSLHGLLADFVEQIADLFQVTRFRHNLSALSSSGVEFALEVGDLILQSFDAPE